jgi:biopolymer transport protein ExbD
MGSKLSGAAGTQGGQSITQNAAINVTPFVDIMLVLLIIFMVSAPLATVSINLDLPPARNVRPERPAEPVYVTVQESGALFIGDRPTTLNTLATDLCTALGGGDCKDERLFVRAQAGVRYDSFMGVMNTLQANGFFKVGLLNEDIE